MSVGDGRRVVALELLATGRRSLIPLLSCARDPVCAARDLQVSGCGELGCGSNRWWWASIPPG